MNSFESDAQSVTRRTDTFRYGDDEIDLLELFAVMWRGKWVIVGVTLFCAVVAFVYIKLQPSIYEIQASIGATTSYDIESLQPATLEGGDRYQVEPPMQEQVYIASLNLLDSINTKRRFWEQRTGDSLPNLIVEGNGENVEAFKRFIDSLRITIPDVRSGEQQATLTLESEQPDEAIALLNDYLAFGNQQAVGRVIEQLRGAYEANIRKLDFDYTALKSTAVQKLEDELLRLREAHDLASALGIVETPYEQVENVELRVLDNRVYLLGTKALYQEIKALEQRREKPIEAFVPKLRDLEQWRGQMENDLKELNSLSGDVDILIVASPPESSLTPVKPQKLLLFIAAVFAAGIVSVVIVFIRHGIRSYKAREISS